jgi:hypothetical protein
MKPRYAFLLAVLLGITAYALVERLHTPPANNRDTTVSRRAAQGNTNNVNEPLKPAPSPPTPRAFVSDELRFEDVVIEKRPFGEYELTLKFPRLVRAEGVDPKSVRAFDRAARRGAYEHFEWVPKSLKEAGDPAGFMNVGYEVTYATPELVSVTFTACSICCRAGTAGCDVRVLNYDLRSRRELTPSDIFKPRSGYARTLMDYCEPIISERYNYGGMVGDTSFRERAKEYRQLAITPTGINVRFNEYAVAPGSAGTPEVLVPYSVIHDKLNSRSPVARLSQ